MALKFYKPTSPGIRHKVSVDRSGLWKGRPEKTLTETLKPSCGRNNNGRITCRHKERGHKKLYRLVDFVRGNQGSFKVERIEYDPNRTAHIALIKCNKSGKLAYIIAPQKISVGDTITAGSGSDIVRGNSLKLKDIPVGTLVYNVELFPGKGGQLCRSAGTSAQISGRDGKYTIIKLPSGELRLVLSECMASIGVVSNPDQKNTKLGKAGCSRWRGRRPTVRGVAMNPIDHPHGGGEGKTSGGRHPVSPWGLPTKGKKTRKNKVTSKFIIRRRK